MAEYDKAAAQAFKDETDAKIKVLEEEAEKLTGKENKKARSEKGKEVSALKNTNEYIDAEKILKDKEPVHGNFVKGGAKKEEPKKEEKPAAGGYPGPAEEAKDDKKDKKDDKKKPKKQESAGISPEERKELEDLKNKIIDKKKELKAAGMSGGQMNKEPTIVEWVARMNELKEKENPGALQAEKDAKKAGGKKKALSSEAQAQLDEKKKAFEEYTEKLRTEFKYSKKEIAADPDYQDMAKEIKALESGK